MHELLAIPDGRPGLDAKLRKIRALVEEAKRDPWFRSNAAAIVRHVAERDQVGEVEAVWQFVRDHVRYLRDPWSADGLEVFTTPKRLLQDIASGTAAEDCDGHVILASALIETIGYPTRYRIGGVPPDHFRHIWLEAQTNKGWLPVELTKKDETFDYDPSHRFPLTLTLTGNNMLDNGLGAPTFQRANTGKLSAAYMAEMEKRRQHMQRPGGHADRARRAIEERNDRRVQTAAELVASGATSRYDQYSAREKQRIAGRHAADAARSQRAARRTLSAIDPTPQEQRWADEASTDVWDDRAMLGELSGPFSKLKKLRKRVLKKAKKVVKVHRKIFDPIQHMKMLKKSKVARKLFDPRQHLKMLGKAFKPKKVADGGGDEYFEDYGEDLMQPGGAGGTVSSDPNSTGLMPPDLWDTAQGDYDPGTGDPFRGWDAQTEQQEIDSLYTPAMREMIAPDADLPEGDYYTTPDWPGTEDAYDDPSSSWGGDAWGYDEETDMQAADDPTDYYGETDTPKGLGDWLSELAQQVAQTGLQYGQAALQAKAAKKGYGNLAFGPRPPAAVARIAVPQQSPPPAASAAMKYGPWIIAGVGAVLVVALMGGSRRSR